MISGKGVRMHRGVGSSLCLFYLILLILISHGMKSFCLSETKLKFLWIFLNLGGVTGFVGSSEPAEPPLDPPL